MTKPMMAPERPADFVPRPIEFEAIKGRLLDASGDAAGITAALRGAGGYGKTTLARALAHDPDIHDAYFDGVLWVELGQQGGQRVIPVINDLLALLTGASPKTTTLGAARTALAEALGDRRILLIVDDVWARWHLDAFLHGGRHTTRLVTTRFDKELPDTAVRQPVDAMQADEALALLAHGLPPDQAKASARELNPIVALYGTEVGGSPVFNPEIHAHERQAVRQRRHPRRRPQDPRHVPVRGRETRGEQGTMRLLQKRAPPSRRPRPSAPWQKATARS